jgi:hypothetical protein
VLGGGRGGRRGYDDAIDPEPAQLGGELREALRVACREPALEDEVLPFDLLHHHAQCEAPGRDVHGTPGGGIQLSKELIVVEGVELGA